MNQRPQARKEKDIIKSEEKEKKKDVIMSSFSLGQRLPLLAWRIILYVSVNVS